MIKKQIIFYLLAFIFGAVCSFYFFKLQKTETNNLKTKFERETGFEYISPLLDCEYIEPITELKASEIKNLLNKEVSKATQHSGVNRVAIYYRDLTNGPWFGINEDANFAPASLLKVPVMMAIYKEAETNPEILNQIIVTDENIEFPESNGEMLDLPNDYQPKEKLQPKTEYSVGDLIHRMISYSDNDSFFLLLKSIPIESIKKVHSDLGMTFPETSTPDNYVSVKSYASLFRVLYNASYLSNEFSSQSLSIMADTTFDKGISGGLPEEIKVANKFGIHQTNDPRNPVQLHDCGIVYFPGNPYILCVMTQGSKIAALEKVISTTSKIVYEGMKN